MGALGLGQGGDAREQGVGPLDRLDAETDPAGHHRRLRHVERPQGGEDRARPRGVGAVGPAGMGAGEHPFPLGQTGQAVLHGPQPESLTLENAAEPGEKPVIAARHQREHPRRDAQPRGIEGERREARAVHRAGEDDLCAARTAQRGEEAAGLLEAVDLVRVRLHPPGGRAEADHEIGQAARPAVLGDASGQRPGPGQDREPRLRHGEGCRTSGRCRRG